MKRAWPACSGGSAGRAAVRYAEDPGFSSLVRCSFKKKETNKIAINIYTIMLLKKNESNLICINFNSLSLIKCSFSS